MANPLPESGEVTNAFRVLRKRIKQDPNKDDRDAVMALTVLLEQFLEDVHTIAKMAERAQGTRR